MNNYTVTPSEALSSPNLTKTLQAQLMRLIPEAFSEGKLDVAALKRVLGETEVIENGERYRLDWAGKTESYKVLQTPSSATLRPDRDQSIDFDHAPHVFIEGENLEVLKVLQKSYFGKVKLIYIDPPYNTGSDSFVYPDRFQENKEEYLKRINELDDDGSLMREGAFRKNSRESGHYHSNWLSMMLPRLYIARNLLRDDGVIFVSIDGNEVHNLRCLMDEVFGTECYKNSIAVRRGIKSVQSQFSDIDSLSQGHEYILFYAKNSTLRLPKLTIVYEKEQPGKWDTFWRGTDRYTMRYELFGIFPEKGQWRWEKGRTEKAIENYKTYLKRKNKELSLDEWYLDNLTAKNIKLDFVRLNKDGKVQYYIPPRAGKLSSDNWMDILLMGNETEFDTEKNVLLLRRIVDWITSDNDIILDFFAGSATTAHAVMQANYEDGGNRQFIMVQLPEKCTEDSSAFKAGYSTIADISRQRIRKVIQQMEEEQSSDLLSTHNSNLGFKSFVLVPSNFKQWRGDHIETAEQLVQQIELFTQPEKDGATTENILFELLLRFGQPLTTPIEILDIGIRNQESGIRNQESGIRNQESGIRNQENYTL